jgi:hypothetical protein
MYYEDQSLCRYHSGCLHADSWHVPLRAIGWLESGHSYNQGPTPTNLAEKLDVLIETANGAFRHYHFRGLHDCTLCEPGHAHARLARSHVNILIPHKQAVFASPAGILHYILAHSHLPPSEFLAAVDECPQYGSPEYFEALRVANDGHPVPLMSWEDMMSAQRKETEKLVRYRQGLLGSSPKK